MVYIIDILQAFRKLYEQVGLGWVYAITKYEPVSLYASLHDLYIVLLICLCLSNPPYNLQIATIADSIYGVWAKYRLQITGKTYVVLESFKCQLVDFTGISSFKDSCTSFQAVHHQKRYWRQEERKRYAYKSGLPKKKNKVI